MSTHSDEPARSFPKTPTSAISRTRPKTSLRPARPSRSRRAQFQIARQYGFASWSKLKAHVESLQLGGQLKLAIVANDLEEVKRLMTRHPELHRTPLAGSQSPPLTWVADRAACRPARHGSPWRGG